MWAWEARISVPRPHWKEIRVQCFVSGVQEYPVDSRQRAQVLRLLWAFFQTLPDREDSFYWHRCCISGCPSCCGFSVMRHCHRHSSSLTGHLPCEASLLSITNTSPLCIPTIQNPQSVWVCFSLESSLWVGTIYPIHVHITLPDTTPPSPHTYTDTWMDEVVSIWSTGESDGQVDTWMTPSRWVMDGSLILEGWMMEWWYRCLDDAWIINNRWMKSFEWIWGLDRGMIR